MIEPEMELALWATLEASSFVAAVLVVYRRMGGASAESQRLRHAVVVVAAYGAILSLAYAAWYYFGNTFTLYGSFLFGCLSGGLHVVLMATVLLIVGQLVPWSQ
jgi:hypothetical protein